MNKKTQFKLALKILKKIPMAKNQKEEAIRELKHEILEGDIFEKKNS